MKKAIEKLGLHLTVLLHKAGADDQAYEEILESLERARERAQNPPEDSANEPTDSKRTMDVASMKLLVGGA
jgi:hypothetical protein